MGRDGQEETFFVSVYSCCHVVASTFTSTAASTAASMNTAAAADDAAAAAVASQYHSDKAQRLCALFDIYYVLDYDS